ERVQHFLNCLVKFWLCRILGFYQLHYLFDVLGRSFHSWRCNCTSTHKERSCLLRDKVVLHGLILIRTSPVRKVMRASLGLCGPRALSERLAELDCRLRRDPEQIERNSSSAAVFSTRPSRLQ